LKQEAYNGVVAGTDYTIDYKIDLVGNGWRKRPRKRVAPFNS